MIDLKIGKIECNRFRIEYCDTEKLFKKRFVANCIKDKTHYFYNPDIKIDNYIANDAKITFDIDGKVTDVEIKFTCHGENENHAEFDMLIAETSNLVQYRCSTWSAKYGTISLLKIGNETLLLTIKYNQWNVAFITSNKWIDILWSFTKVKPSNEYCAYRKWTFYDGDIVDFEYCTLYATHGKCRGCKRNCKYSRMWSVNNSPTYKELEKELEQTKITVDDISVELGPIRLIGTFQNSFFDIGFEDGQVLLTVIGVLDDFYDFLSFIDKIANIKSDWYKSNKI